MCPALHCTATLTVNEHTMRYAMKRAELPSRLQSSGRLPSLKRVFMSPRLPAFNIDLANFGCDK